MLQTMTDSLSSVNRIFSGCVIPYGGHVTSVPVGVGVRGLVGHGHTHTRSSRDRG